MVGGSGRVSGHPGVRFEQTVELFGGWLPGSVLIRVLGSLPDADHCWWRGFVGGGDMGNEETGNGTLPAPPQFKWWKANLKAKT